MRAYLSEANRDLQYQIEVVQELTGAAKVAGELTPYFARVAELCAALRRQAIRNLKDLEYGLDDTLADILAATQSLTALFELVNTRLASPVVRAREADRLALLFLRWLHDTTPETSVLPFGVSDGNFAVYPTPQVPPVYLVPVTRQVTLLYLPLFFHEFGHLLYACHKPEMDDLVKEFQKVVAAALAPQSIRDRTASVRGSVFRRKTVTAWFAWVQEFFCDAAGLTIGGPSFLSAFSHFFRTRSSDQYYVGRDEQLDRRHPVTWLRAKVLVDRARRLRYDPHADAVERAWAETARLMGVKEDYEGTWLDEFLVPLQRTLDDMLEETQPYRHRSHDVTPPDDLKKATPVQLCNMAWRQFDQQPNTYRAWEREEIQRFLQFN